MTDAEIVKCLAERDGVFKTNAPDSDFFIAEGPPFVIGDVISRDEDGPLATVETESPNYLSDRNALARVIGKMTTDERELFHHLLVAEWLGSTSGQSQSCWLFTCDPRVIAECVAKAIHAAKGGG